MLMFNDELIKEVKMKLNNKAELLQYSNNNY